MSGMLHTFSLLPDGAGPLYGVRVHLPAPSRREQKIRRYKRVIFHVSAIAVAVAAFALSNAAGQAAIGL